jgi:hypothetical protein
MKDPELWCTFVRKFGECIQRNEEYQRKAHMLTENIHSGVNTLLYSGIGFPLEVFWNYVATCEYGTFHVKDCTYEKTITYVETPYFIELDFSNPNNKRSFDAVENLVKTVISTRAIHATKHLIVCKNVDDVDDFCALRVLLERFNHNAMFLCMTYNVSSLEQPIRSRFSELRIPLFSCSYIEDILLSIGGSYHPILKARQCRNVYKCIVIDDLARKGHDVTYVATYNYPIIKTFMEKKSHTILEIREFSNKVCSDCVPFPQVVEDLLMHVSDKAHFVARASDIQHRLVRTNGGRKPLYYESLFHAAIYGKTINTLI